MITTIHTDIDAIEHEIAVTNAIARARGEMGEPIIAQLFGRPEIDHSTGDDVIDALFREATRLELIRDLDGAAVYEDAAYRLLNATHSL